MRLRSIITDNMGLSLIFRGLVQPSDRMGELLMTLFDQARHFKVLDFREWIRYDITSSKSMSPPHVYQHELCN